ncbi:hypothetical protein VTK56DRAFT_4473 [Thermocarpiscus australiensis]
MYYPALSSPTFAEGAWPARRFLPDSDGRDGVGDGGGDSDEKLQNWSSLIGIVTAICGNVLIALALNVQRYAHIRLHRRRIRIRERAKQAMRNALASGHTQGPSGKYGTAGTSNEASTGNMRMPKYDGAGDDRYSDNDARDSSETEPLAQSLGSSDPRWKDYAGDDEVKIASTYLKDPYWWLGQVLITVGELGNFLAYGFAPASIVSPLGVVALISNCIIAPIFFKEVFRQRDFLGVFIAILGAVTVVLSAKTKETKLGPHEVWGAITTMEFEIYMGVSCALIVFLMWLSPRYGNRTILIDLGLVGLFGGYTALSTKGVSSMLSSTLLGAFATPVTYVLVSILLFTAVMQVRYVNKALQRFDSTQVIPIQFVLFTLSVIIGSAVLYRDFERTTSEQAVKFVGGCLFTFFGVFLITSGRPRQDDEDEVTLSDAEGIEETIGLSEQDYAAAAPTPRQTSRLGNFTPRSRGSSRASHASFKEVINKPLVALSGAGFPSSRVPAAASGQKAPFIDEDDREDSPLLGNPWRGSSPPDHPDPGLSRSTSSDSTVSLVTSTSVSDGAAQRPQDHPVTTKPAPTIPAITGTTPPQVGGPNRPETPRAPASASRLPPSHHYTGPVISPSPFSSTLSAVVADKLLAHIDGGRDTHSSSSPMAGLLLSSTSTKRTRPGLRNSLFAPAPAPVPQDGENRPPPPPPPRGHGHSQSEQQRRRQLGDSAGEPGSGNSEANEGSLRARARSLSRTLGLEGLGLFGGGGSSAGGGGAKRRDPDGSDEAEEGDGDEEVYGVLARARTATATLRTRGGSVETL